MGAGPHGKITELMAMGKVGEGGMAMVYHWEDNVLSILDLAVLIGYLEKPPLGD